MGTRIFQFFLCILLFATSAHADGLPFLSDLRAEVAAQLTIASNDLPASKALAAKLRTSLKTIDRTKPTLVAGSTALGALTKSLGATTLSNTFLPLINNIRGTYVDALDTSASTLEERLADTYPGPSRTAAEAALSRLRAATDAARTNINLTLALKALSAGAKAEGLAQKAVAKAEAAKPGASFASATITETDYGMVTITATKSFVDGWYDPNTGELNIQAAQLKKLTDGRFEGRSIDLFAELTESGQYVVSLTNEAYAYYVHGIVRDPFAEEPEILFNEDYYTIDPVNARLGTGTMTVNLDLTANVAWGTFTFTASGAEDSNRTVSVTGSFLVRLVSPDEG